MKKIISAISVISLALVLASCGSSSGNDAKPVSDSKSSESTADSSESKDDNPGSEETEAEASEATIDETVIFDDQGIKVTAKELNLDGMLGPELKLLIENNSESDLTFQARNASVNGYMIDTMMSVDVADGKKANDSLTFSGSGLKLSGIDNIAAMCFSLHVFDSSTWDTFADSPEIELHTSIFNGYDFTYDDSGEPAYEWDGIKIVIKGVDEDATIMGPDIIVYIENTTDSMITVQTRDLSVNGFMLDPVFSCDLVPGRAAVDTITLMESDLEENGIESIDEAELSFHIFNADTWDTIIDTPSKTFNFGG